MMKHRHLIIYASDSLIGHLGVVLLNSVSKTSVGATTFIATTRGYNYAAL
jgi:hypothetical protein